MRVQSNLLNSITYRKTGKTIVGFTDGSRYEFDNIPEAVVRDWQRQLSVGHFFLAEIRGRYNSRKITPSRARRLRGVV